MPTSNARTAKKPHICNGFGPFNEGKPQEIKNSKVKTVFTVDSKQLNYQMFGRLADMQEILHKLSEKI